MSKKEEEEVSQKRKNAQQDLTYEQVEALLKEAAEKIKVPPFEKVWANVKNKARTEE